MDLPYGVCASRKRPVNASVNLNYNTRMCSMCTDNPPGKILPICYLIYDQLDKVNLHRSSIVILMSNVSKNVCI